MDVTMANLDVTINYLPSHIDHLPIIFKYVETIQISLWDTAFFRKFAIDKGIHKNYKIKKQLNFKPGIQRYYISILSMYSSLLKPFPNLFHFLQITCTKKARSVCSWRGSWNFGILFIGKSVDCIWNVLSKSHLSLILPFEILLSLLSRMQF